MIPFNYRFHGHNSLLYVYRNGQVVRSRLVALRYITNKNRKLPRIAVVVSKKTLKSAVGRNRIRRRVYEYLRQEIPNLNGVYDIVVIVQSSEVLNLASDELTAHIGQLIIQAGIRKPSKDTPKTPEAGIIS